MKLLAFAFALVAISTISFGQTPAPSLHWISSTENQPWQDLDAPAISTGQTDDPAALHIDPQTQYQVIDGFSGCFNEVAWDALQAVGPDQRTEALKALFDPGGCRFTNCRMGMGANDFARDWYSFDETLDDFGMKDFNIDRDKKSLIPYIKAAMQYAPKLQIWGVPWSPPSWMKTNNSFKRATFKMEPKYLSAYALYFSKYVQAYRHEGINVYAVHPQNEPVTNQGDYPQCRWSGPDLQTFVRDYLTPQLKEDSVDVQVWLGTINDSDMNHFTNLFLGDPATNAMITGVGYQYEGQDTFGPTHAKYPDKKMMQTETECHHGENTWDQGLTTLSRIAKDMNNSANGYDFWNMILNEKHTSTWNWCQNSLLILDSKTQKVIYNPDFYAMKHYSHFVQSGAHRIDITGSDPQHCIAFQNPGGEVVVVVGNDSANPLAITLQLGLLTSKLSIPPKSMNTVVLSGWSN